MTQPPFELPPETIFRHTSFLDVTALNRPEAELLLARAATYLTRDAAQGHTRDVLAKRTVVNVFLEPSTRTRASFELAAKRLSADVVNVTGDSSSVKKGESLRDTLLTLEAMGADLLILRHRAAGAAAYADRCVGASVVNAGDGAHAHPTQALLDALTLRQHFGSLEGRVVAICGDIARSRVARSTIILLQLLGAQIRVAAPATLTPVGLEDWGVTVCATAREAAQDCDAVMTLRIQHERLSGQALASAREYTAFYAITPMVMAAAKPDAVILHPGPMNRGVEIDPALADRPHSLITNQVEAGVAARMAVLALLWETRLRTASNREIAGAAV